MNVNEISYIRIPRKIPRADRRWWQRWFGPDEEIRRIPGDYLPFAEAYLAAFYAKEALRDVADLLHIPAQAAADLIDAAVWDAAGDVLAYFDIRRTAWEIDTDSHGLPADHPLLHTAHATRQALRAHAQVMDAECTSACKKIEQVCRGIVGLRETIQAEDRVRAALRRAGQRGAYSGSTYQPGRTVDLSDRVAGLASGLREMAAA